MHLLIPFASSISDACAHVLNDLSLQHLGRLLSRLTPTVRDDGDEYSLSPPHERALAAAQGWPVVDGCLPFAAQAAAADGLAVGERAWGLVTPSHWHVGRDHVTLADPAALALTDGESRAALDVVRGLFESEGFEVGWGAATRWYVAHESLAELPAASLDRVIGRNVELWLRPGNDSNARLLRRLQSEMQLLMYPHPINERREEAGRLTLNSFWLSGCGRHRGTALSTTAVASDDADTATATATTIDVDDSLRAPLLGDDWAGWAEAWRRLDAEVLPRWLAAVERGSAISLTLCGERSAQRFEAAPRSFWQKMSRRWQPVAPATLLAAL